MDALEKCRALESEAKARREAMRAAHPDIAQTVDRFRSAGMNPVGIVVRHNDGRVESFGRPLARATDPRSSHDAAQAHVASGTHAEQKAAVLSLVRAKPDATSAELALVAETTAIPLDRYAVARRLPDLEKDGKVRRTGMRECRVSGRRAVTWGLL